MLTPRCEPHLPSGGRAACYNKRKTIESSVRAALAIWRSVGRSAARETGVATQPGAQTDGRGVSPLSDFGSEGGLFRAVASSLAQTRSESWPRSRRAGLRWFCIVRPSRARVIILPVVPCRVAPATRFPAGHSCARKPLNLVAGWIDTVTIKRDATLSAHECKRPHAGDDARLTSEGVRLAALAVESDRHRARQ